MIRTLQQQSQTHNNDYTSLEAAYHRFTGGELVLDPYNSPRHPVPNLTLTASVIIPAWNAHSTIEQCLIAIEQSTFNRKYPQQLEVIVVDDGSTDGTWEFLQALRLGVRLKAVQQTHHSRAHTQNTGIAIAEGNVIISCDADMILTPFTIEEMVKRHQVLPHGMLIGFRGDVQRDDAKIQLAVLREHLPHFLPPFMRDVRLNYSAGWPESMCRDSDHLKWLGEGRHIITPDGIQWGLANMVYGALFSLSRADFVAMDGYDERFYGWGCEDTLVGVRALAMSTSILPVYSAAGLHIAHSDRSGRKWQEFAANQRVFKSILQSPFVPDTNQWLPYAKGRIQHHFERNPSSTVEMDACLSTVFAEELADPERRGKYLYSLGRYAEAEAAFAEIQGTFEQESWALFDRGKTLRAGRQAEQAIPLLKEATARLPKSVWPLIELTQAYAAQGLFTQARASLTQARTIEPANAWIRFLLQGKHLKRATLYRQQGTYTLALRDYEAALLLDAESITTQRERALTLVALGQQNDACRAMEAYAEHLTVKSPRYGAALLELARLHLTLGNLGPAKSVLEQTRRHGPQNREGKVLMEQIHTAASQAYPLPHARMIAERVQSIPGWFSIDEAELLISLVLRAVANASVPVILEIGSYCGRATIAMGLTLQGVGRTDAQILARDEPSVGMAPDGQTPQTVLQAYVGTYGLQHMITCTSQDDVQIWQRSCQLLLIDGKHDYDSVRADMERYAPCLVAGGLLVFHDYAHYFPDVQRYVNELLIDSSFEFVAHTGTLLALVYHPHSSAQVEVIQQAATVPHIATPRIWMYWEGPMPDYISLCYKTIVAHNPSATLLNRTAFDDLFMLDRDIDIDALSLPHKADFIRAHLLKHYGGLYLDMDCVVMRDLTPLLELAKQHEFVGYREQQGYMSCALMVSEVDGAVITEHYTTICAILRSKRQREWLDLTSTSMDKAIATCTDRYVLLPTERIMPINWAQSEEFCVCRSDVEHLQHLQQEAWCYMLSNNTFTSRPQTQRVSEMSEQELLNEQFFLSFLFRKSLFF